MQCKCGEETKDSKAVDKKSNLKWTFIICKSCGFIDHDLLFDYDGVELIAQGLEARRIYDSRTTRN